MLGFKDSRITPDLPCFRIPFPYVLCTGKFLRYTFWNSQWLYFTGEDKSRHFKWVFAPHYIFLSHQKLLKRWWKHFLIMKVILVPFFVGTKPGFVPRDLRNHAYFLFLVTRTHYNTTLYSQLLGKFWQNYFEAWNSLERVRAFFSYLRRK